MSEVDVFSYTCVEAYDNDVYMEGFDTDTRVSLIGSVSFKEPTYLSSPVPDDCPQYLVNKQNIDPSYFEGCFSCGNSKIGLETFVEFGDQQLY